MTIKSLASSVFMDSRAGPYRDFPQQRLPAGEHSDYTLIDRSGLFDREWYLEQYPDARHAKTNLLIHYLRQGAKAGHDPNPLFAGKWYLGRYPEVRITGSNPLIDYLRAGAAKGRDPSPFFDSQFYRASNPAIAGYSNPLAYYLHQGWKSGVLPFNPATLLAGMKIAVVVHLFYSDLWPEIVSWLAGIPIDFDVFVSLPREDGAASASMILRDCPQAQIIEVANKGRDVGAFFSVLPKVLAGNYSVICKLHSKKGLDYPDAWRDLLLRGLLANKMLVARILHAFKSDDQLVLAGPRQAYLSGPTQITENEENVYKVLRNVYPDREISSKWGFFAGTMFWARPDFFRRLCDCESLLAFENDNSRNDGQLAHAMERVFGAAAATEGKRIGLTDVAGLGFLDGKLEIVDAPGIPSQQSFVRVLRDHSLRLNGQLPFKLTHDPVPRKLSPTFSARQVITNWAHQANVKFPKTTRYSLRVAKVCWWTVTLQIVPRIRDVQIRRWQAKLIASSPLFDRDWYLEKYADIRAAGADPALHYLVRGAAEHRDPSPHFDTAWYLGYYADVAASGVNPLVHYLRYGAKELRRPRPADMVVGEVTEATLECRKQPSRGGEIALFVAHAIDGRLKPHVQHYLEALKKNRIKPVLVINADGDFPDDESQLLETTDGLYVRKNVGYDFGAWAHVLTINPGLMRANILYLINDSSIGPLDHEKFSELLDRIRSSKSDVIGLTDSYERGWHIQSYFTAFKSTALKSAGFRNFLSKIRNLAEKDFVVTAYEVRLAGTLQASGLSCEVLFPAERGSQNPSLSNWKYLIDLGLPFVKAAALRKAALAEGRGDWKKFLRTNGIDHRIVEQVLNPSLQNRIRA